MTTTDKRYRVLSLTNIGRALVEEMIATDDEGDARRFLRASAFPAAIVEGRRVTASNKRGADYEDAFEAFARSGPAVLVARPVAAKSVKPVEMPAREPTRAPDEPVNAREIARRAVVANPPVSPVGSIEAPAANGSISSKSSPAVEAQPEPVSAADEFEPAPPVVAAPAPEARAAECQRADCAAAPASYAPSLDPILRPFCRSHRTGIMGLRVLLSITTAEAVKRSLATGTMRAARTAEPASPAEHTEARCEAAGECPNPAAGRRDHTPPCMLGLCAHHRKAVYNRRDNWSLTMEEAASSIRVGANTREDAHARCRAATASQSPNEPAPVEAPQPPTAPVEPLVACDGDCDGGGHGDAPAAPPAVVAEGEPSAPLTEPQRAVFAVEVPSAPGFTLDDVRRVAREELRALLAPLFAGVGL